MKIIDCHSHIKTIDELNSFELDLECDNYLIVRTPTLNISETEFFSFINSNKKFFTLDCVFTEKLIDDEINRLEENIKNQPKMVGIKLMLEDGNFTHPHSEECLKVYNLCAKHNKAMVFHNGSTEYSQVELVPFIAKQFPKVNFIMSHMGGLKNLETSVQIVSENENIYTDISGLIHTKNNNDEFIKNLTTELKSLKNRFPTLSKKLMFGTDFLPTNHRLMVTASTYIKMLNQVFFQNEIEDICYNNFKVIYKV